MSPSGRSCRNGGANLPEWKQNGPNLLTEPTNSTSILETTVKAALTTPCRQSNIDVVEFAGSARKHYAEHGISDADALHVIRNPFRLIEQEGDYEDHLLIIGVDLGARLLEVVVIPADDPRRIIRVNLLQPKNYDYL